MLSKDLSVGAHVAYDINKSRNYHSFCEAYVIAHRPKGNKSSYWGGRTGNNDTIGIMYTRPWYSDVVPQITFSWVSPSSLHFTWEEHQAIEDRDTKRKAEIKAQRDFDESDRRARWADLPDSVRKAVGLSDWAEEYFLERGSYANHNVTIDIIEAIVEAARQTDPLGKSQARVQAEVEAALELL